MIAAAESPRPSWRARPTTGARRLTDLICSYYTTACVSPLAGGSSSQPFEARVRACAEAGYTGVGIHVRDYRAMRQAGAKDEDLRAILHHHGIHHVEVEFLLNWFADGAAGEQARRDEDLLHHMVETFGARVMYLGGDMAVGNPLPFDELIERFAPLAARAAERGITLGVEPCAWSNVGTLDEGLRLVEGVGAKNVGVVLDVWHLYRRGLDFGRIRALDPALIAAVQLGDAGETVVGALAEDSLDHRLLPGEGAADAAGFVAAVKACGYTGPLSVEILSIAQRARLLPEAAQVSADAARAVIEAV